MYNLLYLFFKYGKPVLLLTPTIYPFGNSQGVPLFGVLLLKKKIVWFLPPLSFTFLVYKVHPSCLYGINSPPHREYISYDLKLSLFSTIK